MANNKQIMDELKIIRELTRENSKLLLTISRHITNGIYPPAAPESTLIDDKVPGYIN